MSQFKKKGIKNKNVASVMKQHRVLYQNSVMESLIRKQIRFFTKYASQLIGGKNRWGIEACLKCKYIQDLNSKKENSRAKRGNKNPIFNSPSPFSAFSYSDSSVHTIKKSWFKLLKRRRASYFFYFFLK